MPPSITKPCHNCRRRRLRCDRSWPTCHKCAVSGQDCLGYGKVFVWTQGIDAQGNVNPPPGRRVTEEVAEPLPGLPTSLVEWSARSSTLTDPLFQDLDRSSRYYLAHCRFPSLFSYSAPLPFSLFSDASTL